VEGVRINRFLAAAGLGSRRAVESLVLSGRVAVNGVTETGLGRRVLDGDTVTLDGERIGAERHVYLLLHKPDGVVSTASDPQGRPTVVDIVGRSERVFPVGRLDLHTTGALLLTNDGDLANRLMHPRHRVEKVYDVVVTGEVDEQELTALREGIELDGRLTSPAAARVVSRRGTSTRLEIVLREGRNRQVRRMCEALGHRVLHLHRPRYATLTVDGLAPGGVRRLTSAEVEALRDAAG
jgi:pseudouridine synthase